MMDPKSRQLIKKAIQEEGAFLVAFEPEGCAMFRVKTADMQPKKLKAKFNCEQLASGPTFEEMLEDYLIKMESKT